MTEREDIEMAFVRTLSTGGVILSGDISAEDKRERIRIAIMQQGLKDAPFDASMTYGEAFHRCFARAAEMRRTPRDGFTPAHRSIARVIDSLGPSEDEDDDDDDDDAEDP